jgi:hypothetical protein
MPVRGSTFTELYKWLKAPPRDLRRDDRLCLRRMPALEAHRPDQFARCWRAAA